jgi:hypothetical protein
MYATQNQDAVIISDVPAPAKNFHIHLSNAHKDYSTGISGLKTSLLNHLETTKYNREVRDIYNWVADHVTCILAIEVYDNLVENGLPILP